MADLTTKTFTYTLTNSTFIITGSMGLTKVSALLISGTASVLGGLAVPGYPASGNVAMQSNIPINFYANSGNPIDGVSITASSGVVQIIATQ